MPRRRSRSGRKGSADVKNPERSAQSAREDEVASGLGDAAEYSSGREGTDSAEEESRLPGIVEPLIGAADSKIPDPRSTIHEVSSTKLESFVDESRCCSSINTKAKIDDIQNIHLADDGRSRPKSLVSRSKQIFESRYERGERDDKRVRSANQKTESQENVYTSQQDRNSKEYLAVKENVRPVSSESKHFRNISSSEEYTEKEDGWGVNRLKEDNSDVDKQLLKMASPVDVPPEGTDDATRSGSTSEEWDIVLSKRQRRLQRSKDRGDEKQKECIEHSDGGNDLDIFTEDEESKFNTKEPGNQTRSGSPRSTSDYKPKSEICSDLPANKTLSVTSNEKNLDSEYDTKLSVFEIKRRFSCHAEKSNESFKLRAPSHVAEGDSADADDPSHRGRERAPQSGGPGPCTTELYMASVAGKESSSASFLSAAESSSGILMDDKSVKYKPKSLHSGWTNDAEPSQVTTEAANAQYRCSDSNKVSVKQLKERLISSCSDISDKAVEGKGSDDERNLVKNTSNDTSFEKLSKGYEKDDIGVSVKERLETYRCQASKAYHNIQSFYIEQELPSVTSIKELQSSFNKVVQPSVISVGPVNRTKVKNINEDLAQMQSYSMKCKSCGKQVFFMERIMAEKAMWHKKCFRCKECQKQLTVENYKSQDGELYCQSHYMNILKPKPTDNTVSASSVIEEIKIPPLNLKPLFEKNQNPSQNTPPSSPHSVERSPKFLKRLAKFEGIYKGESDEDDDYEVISSEETHSSSPEKKSKSMESETYLQEEIKSSDAVEKNTSRSSMHMDSATTDVRRLATEAGTAENGKVSNDRKEPIFISFQRNWSNKSDALENGTSIKIRPKSLELRPSRKSRPAQIDLELRDLQKNSVKEMKEQLILSYSDINGKSRLEHPTANDRALQKNNSDGCIERRSRSYENDIFNVCLKERLESYNCQTSKIYNNTQSGECNPPSVSSIKELQSTFNKMSCPNGNNINSGNRLTNKKNHVSQKQSISTNCKSCGKKVFFMERITAENSVWHKKCFLCKLCQKQLTLNNYKSENGELYCQYHYVDILKSKTKNTDNSSNIADEINTIVNLNSTFEKESNITASIPSSSNSISTPKSPKFMMSLAKFDDKCNSQLGRMKSSCREEGEIDTNSDSVESVNKVDDLESYLDEAIKRNTRKISEGRNRNSPRISSKSRTSDFHVQQLLEKNLNDYDYISTTNDQISDECKIIRDSTMVR